MSLACAAVSSHHLTLAAVGAMPHGGLAPMFSLIPKHDDEHTVSTVEHQGEASRSAPKILFGCDSGSLLVAAPSRECCKSGRSCLLVIGWPQCQWVSWAASTATGIQGERAVSEVLNHRTIRSHAQS